MRLGRQAKGSQITVLECRMGSGAGVLGKTQ